VARRRTTVTATMYDCDGYAFVTFRGNAQDVGDAASIYVLNLANPLSANTPLVELVESRETEEES